MRQDDSLAFPPSRSPPGAQKVWQAGWKDRDTWVHTDVTRPLLYITWYRTVMPGKPVKMLMNDYIACKLIIFFYNSLNFTKLSLTTLTLTVPILTSVSHVAMYSLLCLHKSGTATFLQHALHSLITTQRIINSYASCFLMHICESWYWETLAAYSNSIWCSNMLANTTWST